MSSRRSTLAQKTGQVADATYVLDVSGKDVKAVITVGSSTTDLVIVDHATWARQRGQAWQRGKYANDPTIEGITDVWRYLGPIDQLEYVGKVDGSPTRYRYRSTAPIPYRTAVMDRLGLPGSIDALELVLEADGTPVEYQFHGSSRPTSGGMADLAFEMTSRLEFSRWASRSRSSVPRRLDPCADRDLERQLAQGPDGGRREVARARRAGRAADPGDQARRRRRAGDAVLDAGLRARPPRRGAVERRRDPDAGSAPRT